MPPNTIKKLIKLLKWLTYTSLVTAAIISCLDAWSKYQSNDTSIKVLNKRIIELDYPVTTICFQPMAKNTFLNKLNISQGHFGNGNIDISKISTWSWTKLFHEASYSIGLDFNITVMMNNWNHIIKISDFNQSNTNNDIFIFEKFYTLWSGLCYKLTSKVQNFHKRLLCYKLLFLKIKCFFKN